jgi:DNA-binding NarL/FixJ family response regulator
VEPIRVLIVDDSRIPSPVTAQFLDLYEDIRVVATVVTAGEAVAVGQQGGLDVILLDCCRPGGAPISEVAGRLRSALPGVRIIGLVLHDGACAAASTAGVDQLVAKTRMVSELIPAIRDGLNGREGGRTVHHPV